MSISAGSRLLFFSSLTYTLKSGSETLPPIQELYDRPSRIQSISGKDAKVEQLWKKPNYMDIHDCKYPVLDLLQQHLAKSLAKLNFLLATWPLLVCLGRSVMMRPVSLAKPEMLLLSALFAIKGYRLWSWPHRMIEIPPNEESNNKGET